MKNYLLSPNGVLSKEQKFGAQDKNTTVHSESDKKQHIHLTHSPLS